MRKLSVWTKDFTCSALTCALRGSAAERAREELGTAGAKQVHRRMPDRRRPEQPRVAAALRVQWRRKERSGGQRFDSRGMGCGFGRLADSPTREYYVVPSYKPAHTHSHKHTRAQRAQRDLCVCMLHAVLYVLHDDAGEAITPKCTHAAWSLQALP
jgi:hypothetical protein